MQNPTCYFIRNFPDENSVKESNTELAPYHITRQVYGSDLYNTLFAMGQDMKEVEDELEPSSPIFSVHVLD